MWNRILILSIGVIILYPHGVIKIDPIAGHIYHFFTNNKLITKVAKFLYLANTLTS